MISVVKLKLKRQSSKKRKKSFGNYTFENALHKVSASSLKVINCYSRNSCIASSNCKNQFSKISDFANKIINSKALAA